MSEKAQLREMMEGDGRTVRLLKMLVTEGFQIARMDTGQPEDLSERLWHSVAVEGKVLGYVAPVCFPRLPDAGVVWAYGGREYTSREVRKQMELLFGPPFPIAVDDDPLEVFRRLARNTPS